jgi:hypothetical protein
MAQQSPTRSPLTPLADAQPTNSQGQSLAATTAHNTGSGQGALWRFEDYNHVSCFFSYPNYYSPLMLF